jgi:hypothetical protein
MSPQTNRRSWITLAAPLLLLALSAGVSPAVAAAPTPSASPSPSVSPSPTGTLTVWVSPKGSDTNDGLSSTTPFKTLQRANDWLCSGGATCPGRGRAVIIKLAQTTFAAPVAGKGAAAAKSALKTYAYNPGDAKAFVATSTTAWHYFDPKNTTTFQPWSYKPGDSWTQVAAGGGYPTFDGAFGADSGFVFTPLTATGSGSTGLTFLYTKWTRYRRSPVVLGGGLSTTISDGTTYYTETDFTANGVTFYGNYFSQIGNYWNPKNPLGYGAILANNSSGDTYRNNHFVELLNTSTNSDTIHIHGLYISHGSNNSLVEANSFTDITGDAVRQRDRSNGMIVRNNTFTRAGAYGYFDDYFCRPNTPDSYCAPKEYKSYSGTFTGNTLKGLYAQGITGRRTVFCFDITGGLCPTNRISVTS